MFQQREIDSVAVWIALAYEPRDFPRLPVHDAGEDQRQAAAGVHLLPQLARVDSAPAGVEHISRQGVKLLHFEQPAPDPPAQLRFRQILKNKFSLEDAAELAICAVKPILAAEGHQPLEGHRCCDVTRLKGMRKAGPCGPTARRSSQYRWTGPRG